MIRRYKNKATKRKIRVRAKLRKFSQRLRLSVFRSNKHIYAQIIDDNKRITLVSVNDKELEKNKKPLSKKDKASQLGLLLAQKAKKKKITQVYFDRGKFSYHGRIKALATSARKGGLDF